MTDPKTFKEFFHSDDNPDRSLPLHSQSFAVGSAAISNSLAGVALSSGLLFPDNSREKFAEKVSSLSHSDEFISELSEDIGSPMDAETEDQFVERAKKAVAELLRKKLK